MIDQIDERLEAWSKQLAPAALVSFSLPKETESSRGTRILFHLLELAPDAAARGIKDPTPLKIKLGYVVMVSAEEPKEMHRLIGALMFAALENPEWDVDRSPGVELWSALGLAPRPAFVLRVPVSLERPQREVQKVRSHLVIRQSPMRSLSGRVLGPNQLAIMGASVELPALRQVTRTDHEGRFLFPAVPSDPPVSLIRVNAKGREHSITPQRPLASDQPLIIQLTESEI